MESTEARSHTSQIPRTQGCKVCGQDADFYCSKARANYYRCANCGMIFQHPMIELEEMLNYADQEYTDGLYKDYVDARELKYATFRRRIPSIRNHAHGNRLLDVGCSCGYFIDVALEAGFDAYGIEFSSAAISYASPEASARIMQGDVNELAPEYQASYEVISAFDILEHTLEPIEFLLQLRQLLVPNGLLILTTPDTNHWLRPLMRARWPLLQPYQHTYLFSKQSLRLVLEKAGYKNVGIFPTYKVLALEYLAKQVRTLNPLVWRLYNSISPLIPGRIRQRPINVNIGEIMAFGYRED